MRSLLSRTETDSLGKFGFYFFPPIAALVLLGILSFLSLLNIRHSEETTAKSHEAVAIVKDVMRNLLNAETGQRGFLLTNLPVYLEPYHAARGLLQSDLERLRNVTDRLDMALGIKELELVIQERLSQLESSIQLQFNGKTKEANSFIANGVGKETMDRIRAATASIETSFSGKIAESDSKSWAAYFNAIVMSAMALMLALSATIWSLLRVDRELQRRQLSEALIRQRATQLQLLADVIARIVAAKDIDLLIGISLNEFRQLIGAREALIQLRVNGKSRIERGIIAAGIQQPSEEYLTCIFELVSLFARGEAAFFRHRAQLLANQEITRVHAWSICGDAMDGVLTAPIRDKSGEETGRIVLMGKFGDEFNDHDVTIASQLAFNVSVAIENAQLTAQANREAERKDEFLAMLGHELRNPLSGILTGSEALLVRGEGTELNSLFELIHRQSVLMSKIVDDLLDVSRIGLGKIVLAQTHFDLLEILEHLVNDFRRASPKRSILVTVPQPQSTVMICGDRTRIVQSITNILQNACKFSDEYQPIELSVSNPTERSRHVKISITDHGVGLTSQEIDEIFQLFHQSQVSIDRTQGGLGIGLTLAKGLIEMHGGTITVTSQGRGCGAKFTISLPIYDGETVRPRSPSDSVSSRIAASASGEVLGTCRILVIDDRMDVILPIRMLLTQDGHQVAEAYDGSSGFEKARQFKPDMILCDIGLPGEMSGFDVAKAIRQDSALGSVYLVALSGYSQPLDQQRSLESGFDFHVAKPIEHRVLQQLIRFRPKFSK